MDLFSSNIVQLALVSSAGALTGAALLWRRWLWPVALLTLLISGLIFYSFLFNVGEVYQYNYYYKRAFYFIGDDIATALALLTAVALYLKPRVIFYIAMTALVMTGGKTALILFIMTVAACCIFDKAQRAMILRHTAQALVVALVAYLAASALANHLLLEEGRKHSAIVSTWPAEKQVWLQQYDEITRAFLIVREMRQAEAKVDGFSLQWFPVCEPVSACIAQQASASLSDRLYSSIGGLWMTLEGGFGSGTFPNTATKFADLMMQANPWHINDTHGLTHSDWERMGYPQNPYMHFGAGYGWGMLLALLAVWGAIIVMAVTTIKRTAFDPFSVFVAFFCVMTIFNQMQNFIVPGHLLFMHGACAGVVLYRFIALKNIRRPLH